MNQHSHWKWKEWMHQDISKLKTIFINHHRWHCALEVTKHLQPPSEFRDQLWGRRVSGFVLIWKEGHVWMPQLWKQGQVHLFPKNDEPQTTGDARPITLLNTPQHALSHGCMVVERLNDHTVLGSTVCFHCKQTHHFIIVHIFVNFFPYFSFSLKLYWEHRLNSETSSNCELQKMSKSFAFRGMWTVLKWNWL